MSQKAFIAGWRACEDQKETNWPPDTDDGKIEKAYEEWTSSTSSDDDHWPESAVKCEACGSRAVVPIDGQLTCLRCGATQEKT